jgi:hypothetical protein
MAWLAMAVQELLLFARPTPYGGPYVDHWIAYFCYTLVYNLLGVMLVSAPFIVLWLIRHGRSVSSGSARKIHYVQLGLLLLTVALDHADNEVQRFMGIHLSVSLLRTYYKVNAWGSDMGHIILTDRGVPGLPFVILIAGPLALWWAGRRVIRNGLTLPWLPRLLPWPVALTLSVLPLAVPLLVDEFRHPGHNRKQRVVPEIMTLYSELGEDLSEGERPARFEALAREYQARWLSQSADTAWRFTDPERPLMRAPVTPAPAEAKPWNVIFIQLETFRGWNTGHLRPDVTPSATPFIDRLAYAGAYWKRHLSFGPPTISGFIAGHCSIKPHSRVNILTSFTYTDLECLPAVLRRHGYAAELFTGSDPDWDNQTIWLRRWYDAYHYYHDVKGLDRTVFQRAAERIREMGRGPKPFMASVVSISNHYPFVSREPEFEIDPPDRPSEAIRNTMRYTDDVVRELVESLQQEPWFERTLIVITGDHGYSLGEHGSSGQAGGWRELVWVPLVIHGAHPRLPRGGHDEVATLLDIPPTVADLLGIRDPNPWIGSSLLAGGRSRASFAVERQSATFGERHQFSMVVDPASGRARLFDALQDPLQRKDIAAQHRQVVADLERQGDDERQLIDFLLEANLVWRRSDPAP